MKGEKHIKNAETVQCFFRPTNKANGNNEISTVHIPNLSQIQTNKTKETQQLTLFHALSFVSKSSPSKKKQRFCLLSSLLFQIGQRVLSMV